MKCMEPVRRGSTGLCESRACSISHIVHSHFSLSQACVWHFTNCTVCSDDSDRDSTSEILKQLVETRCIRQHIACGGRRHPRRHSRGVNPVPSCTACAVAKSGWRCSGLPKDEDWLRIRVVHQRRLVGVLGGLGPCTTDPGIRQFPSFHQLVQQLVKCVMRDGSWANA